MNERIREIAVQAGFYANPDVEKFEKFAELIVKETINEMIGQLWHHGIDESNNPSFYKAVDRTKEHFGVDSDGN